MSDDYKAKLEKYIELIPPVGGMIESGNAWKPPFDEHTKKMILDPSFYTGTNPLFYKYTGTTHVALVKNWATGGQMTCCNGFAGNCGTAMGAKHFLGQFELEKYLNKIGKGHAYVPSSSGKRPKYGDIFRAAHFHMGVSLGCEGDDFLTVEAGQGGPKSTGYDAIKRKRQKYDPSKLTGWVDMEIYLQEGPPAPEWLVGTWSISGGGDQPSYYQFTKSYKAYRLQTKPIGDSKPGAPLDSGKVEFQGFDNFTIKWMLKAGLEIFRYDRFGSKTGVTERIEGKNNLGEVLSGVR